MPTKPDICSGCRLYDAKMLSLKELRPVDLVVIGGAPREWDLKRGPFMSRNAVVVRTLVTEVNRLRAKRGDREVTVAYTYAALCAPGPEVGFKLAAEDVTRCRPHLEYFLSRTKPKALLLLGADALRAGGKTGSLNDYRGVVEETVIAGEKYAVMGSFHPVTVNKEPGKLNMLRTDIEKACVLAGGGFSDDDIDTQTPIEFNEVMTVLDRLKGEIAASVQNTGKPALGSLDTETTSLTPHVAEDRVIAVSLSFKDKTGLAFPYQHREAPYTPLQMEKLRTKLKDVLGDPQKVFLAEHNRKFDTRWVELKEGLGLVSPGWDTLLMEHTLDEDKKGSYGLKTLTNDYFPGFGKYEAELQEELNRLKAEREDEYRDLTDRNKLLFLEEAVEYWAGLSDGERKDTAAGWLEKGLLSSPAAIKRVSSILEVKKRKYKGVVDYTKKFKTAVRIVFEALPEEERPDIDLPELPDKKEFTKVTYEDVPLPLLLKYAAIDAAITRMLVPKQLERLGHDQALVNKVGRLAGKPLAMPELMWPVRNIDIPANTLLAEMEYYGVRIDRDKCLSFADRLKEEMAAVEDKMFHLVGYEFNPGANADVARILFDEKGMTPSVFSEKTGDPSVAVDVLKDLSDQYPDDEFMNTLLSHRKMAKVHKTYLVGWHKQTAYDGRIHGSFNQAGTATHRLSSTQPNL